MWTWGTCKRAWLALDDVSQVCKFTNQSWHTKKNSHRYEPHFDLVEVPTGRSGFQPELATTTLQCVASRHKPFPMPPIHQTGMTQGLQPPQCQGNQGLNQSRQAQWEPHSQHMCTEVPWGPQICRTNEREYMCPTSMCPRETQQQLWDPAPLERSWMGAGGEEEIREGKRESV